MLKKTHRALTLIQQSMLLLSAHKRLYLFPLCSTILMTVLLSGITVLLAKLKPVLPHINEINWQMVLWFYVFFLVLLSILHFIIFLFNAGLTLCINQYFHKEAIDISQGFRSIVTCFWRIYWWNLLSGTVGIALTLFHSYFKQYGYVQRLLGNLRWNIASFLIVPVMVLEKLPAWSALQRSSQLMLQNFGENIRPNFRFGCAIMLFRLVSLVPLIVAFMIGGGKLIMVGFIATIFVEMLITTILNGSRAIIATAIYYYTVSHCLPRGFSANLQQAFVRSKT